MSTPTPTTVPSSAEVRSRLLSMTLAQLEALGKQCDVPYTTLLKIRNGQTKTPRLETVHVIWPALLEREAAAASEGGAAAAAVSSTAAPAPPAPSSPPAGDPPADQSPLSLAEQGA